MNLYAQYLTDKMFNKEFRIDNLKSKFRYAWNEYHTLKSEVFHAQKIPQIFLK